MTAQPTSAAAQPPDGRTVAALLARLEELSRPRPDRVLRLRGMLPSTDAEEAAAGVQPEACAGGSSSNAVAGERFELLIFRGFSSSTTHPTAYDPDQPALPEDALLEAAELLQGPLNPAEAVLLAGPLPVATYLDPEAWL